MLIGKFVESMNIKKKFLKLKTWVFFVLPCVLFISWLIILIYAYENSINDASLIIGAQLILVAGALIMFCPAIFKRIPKRPLIRGIVSVVLFVCFLGFQVASMAIVPKLCYIWQAHEQIYAELIETSSDDADYQELWTAWKNTNKEQRALKFKAQIFNSVSCIALSLACICAKVDNNIKNENIQ